MPRRISIILLALVAISMAVAGTIGYLIPVYTTLPITASKRLVLQFFDGRVRLFWFYSESHEFRVVQREQFRRVLQIPVQDEANSSEPKEPKWIERLVRSPNLHAVPFDPVPAALPVDHAGPDPPEVSWTASVRIGNRNTVRDFGYGWEGTLYADQQLFQLRTDPQRWSRPLPLPTPWVRVSYVRMPVWLPAGLLLFLPVRTAIRMTRHRRRRRHNECVDCGYNLKGLLSPRCPECGTAIAGFSSAISAT